MHITIVIVLSLPNREGAGGMGVALHQGPLGRINAGGVVSTGQAAISASTSPSGTALLSSAFVIKSHYNGARQHKLHSRVCDLEMALMGCTDPRHRKGVGASISGLDLTYFAPRTMCTGILPSAVFCRTESGQAVMSVRTNVSDALCDNARCSGMLPSLLATLEASGLQYVVLFNIGHHRIKCARQQ